ncbi:glycosyltransferase [Vibrio sp. Isolate33]|uniref:glycosyltransferase n=1 Tax=Vibrio sp. Isolate33 TaxID=2908539 RepID=UPI001EFC6BDD|nr:glycosyltransferase [Vibrio sp. Isolate33]MCG9544446.1 glycosyltransferase [Vibrio sp. Isolate33]
MTNNINVMFVSSHLGDLGPNNQLRYIVTNMPKEVNCTVLVLGRKVDSYNEKLISNKCEVIYLNTSGLMSILKGVYFLKKYVKEKSIGVVHSSGFRCDLLSSILSDVKKVVTVRNMTFLNWSEKGLIGCILALFHLVTINRFNQVVSCSEGVKEHLSHFGIKSEVVDNAVHSSDSHLYKGNNLNRPIINFVTCSSYNPGKNVSFLLQEFSKRDFYADKTLTVIGGIDSGLMGHYQGVKNIKFLGHVSNIFSVIAEADCFLTASRHEGLPNIVLESLLVERPVLLSRIPSHSSINEKVPSVSELFDNDDSNDLERAIKKLEKKIVKTHPSYYQESLNTHFSVSTMALNYSNIYKSIMG